MKTHILLLSLILSFVACERVAVQDDLDVARHAIEQRDYASARSMCDHIFSDQVDGTSKDADALCSLSVLYMKLAEGWDHDDNVDYAVKCYKAAYDADPARTKEFYDSLPVDDMTAGILLVSIVDHARMHDSLHVSECEECLISAEPDSVGLMQ